MGSEFRFQRPSLTGQLKNILEQYPDDGQILKELIQNADDAGARVVRFLLDETHYDSSPDALIHPDMGKFQGPALLVYNDAVFKNNDWAGIGKMFDSVKKDDIIKTGRFGLGFKSIFHITDLPIIASGHYIGLMDPHEMYLNKHECTDSWHLDEHQEYIEKKKAHVRPFMQNIFEFTDDTISKERFYPHTLFRFPLRQESSEISAKCYTAEKVHQLFKSIEHDDGRSLLFLKSVQSIEIYAQSKSNMETHLVHKLNISCTQADDIFRRRQQLIEQIQHGQDAFAPIDTLLPVETEKTSGDSVIQRNWLVYHMFHSDQAVVDTAKKLKVPPWVGIALPLSSVEASNIPYDNPEGQLFYTLPLPLDGTERTGLEFHINAYFALEQNRRHVRWRTADQKAQDGTDPRILWNEMLVEQIIPKTLKVFFGKIIMNDEVAGITSKDLYKLVPNPETVDSKWKPLAPLYCQQLFSGIALHSIPQGWLRVTEAIQLQPNISVTMNRVLTNILCEARFPIVTPPVHVKACIDMYSDIQPRYVSPQDVCTAVEALGSKGHKFAKNDCLVLLQYFLDCGVPEHLIGLPLLPLMSGEMIAFQKGAEPIFIPSKEHPASLLPKSKTRLVDTSITQHMHSAIERLAISGVTQLKRLNPANVIQNLSHQFPSSWEQSDVVQWSPDCEDHPSQTWIEQIWSYLDVNRPDVHCMQILEKVHLLPLDNCTKLGKLGLGRRVIVNQGNQNTFSPEMCDFLQELGCLVMKGTPSLIADHALLLDQFVQSPTITGVVDSLRDVGEQCITTIKGINKELLDAFLSFLSHAGVRLLSDESKYFLSILPIFHTLNNSGFQPSKRVSSKEVPYSSPMNELPVPFPEPVIDASNDKTKVVLEAIDVQSFHRDTVKQVFKSKLLPAIKGGRYTTEETDTLLCHIMTCYPKIITENMNVATEVTGVPFAENGVGERVCPKDLYDPKEKSLKGFLDDSFFPHKRYNTPCMIECMRRLGMKSATDLSERQFLEIAATVANKPCKAQSFILLVKKLVARSPEKKWWEKLINVPFLKVIRDRPDGYPNSLPWKGCATEEILSSMHVCHIKYAKSCGSAVPMVSLDESILQSLGAKTVPTIDDLVYQLSQVSKNYHAKDKSWYLVVLNDIYEKMASFSVKEIRRALTSVSLSSWIWVGQNFQPSSKILLDFPQVNMTPYYYTLPEEMQMHKPLLEKCGVPFSVHLLSVLEEIAMFHFEGNQNCTRVDNDLYLAVKILKVLCKDNARSALIPIDTSDKSKLILKPVEECTVWDHTSEDGFDDDLNYVHPLVPEEVIEHFNIPTVMHRVLEGEELTMENVGQSEPITTRLKSVLTGYTDGLAVLKEMIQNADDAGATEVKLIYDMRQNMHARQSLLDPKMSDWQGPCMWIYNNALFTSEDFQNITKLNGGTKRDKEDQIGVFGLGFNAVYNMTDVPCILSGDILTIFDPHTKYLGRAIRDKTKPGLRINLNKQKGRLLKKYPDQFYPWTGVFGCDLSPETAQPYFNGTLFRLPLRGHKQSVFGEISDKIYDDRNTLDLLRMFYQNGNAVLLFTQNVLRVSVHIIEANGSPTQMKELFDLTKAQIRLLRSHGLSLNLSAPSLLEDRDTQNFINESSILKAAVENTAFERQSQGSGNMTSLDTSMIIQTSTTASDLGGSLLGGVDSAEVQWLVSQSITDVCVHEVQTIAKQLPVAGICIRVRKVGSTYQLVHSDQDQSNVSGSYFSFLPLPIKAPLPIHINGTFAVDQSRRYLMQKTDHDRVLPGGSWNEALMMGPVCKAYMTALSDLSTLTSRNETFDNILPRNIKEDVITNMSNEFWKMMFASPRAFKLFETSSHGRVSLDDAYFLDQEFNRKEETVRNAMLVVLTRILAGTEGVLVHLPSDLADTLKQINAETMRAKTITDEVFFSHYFLPNITHVEPDQQKRDILLVNALKSTSAFVQSTLSNYPCIPTCPDGMVLKCPNSLVHPKGKAAKLYSKQDGKFPYIQVDSVKDEDTINNKLCDLGMVKDYVTWEILVERSQNLTKLGPLKNRKQVQYFLDYLQSKLADTDDMPHPSIQTHLQNEPFLPCEQRPQDWNLPWKGDESCAGMNVYKIQKPLLICTQVPVLHSSLQLSADVTRFLAIKDQTCVSVEIVAKHVCEILGNPQGSTTASSISQSMEAAYAFLNEECINDTRAEWMKQVFSDKPVVLVNGRFVYPTRCAFNPDRTVVPYLLRVTRNHAKLLTALGVRDRFSCQSLVEAIDECSTENEGQPLDDESLYKVNTMLNELYKEITMEEKPIEDLVGTNTIFLPDTERYMRPANSLYYNDSPLQQTGLDVPLVHNQVGHAVASAVGVKGLRFHVLSERSHGIPNPGTGDLAEEIHQGLEAKPFGSEILMDIVREADTIGATEIQFKMDWGGHNSRVFNEKWEKMLGPSLCVEMNAPTNSRDVTGMFLGNKTKGPNLMSSYHITDTPIILTRNAADRECLYGIDPTGQYIEGTSSDQPAMMYKDLPVLRDLFPGVFSGFTVTPDRVTQIRLPLRTAQYAHTDQLGCYLISEQDINDVLQSLSAEGYRILVFMTSLKKITITRYNRLGQRTETVYTSLKTPDDEATASSLNKHINKLLHAKKHSSHKVDYEVKIHGPDGIEEHWRVVQSHGGMEGMQLINEQYSEAYGSAWGGVAELIRKGENTPSKETKGHLLLPSMQRTELPVLTYGPYNHLDNEENQKLCYINRVNNWNKHISSIVADAYTTLILLRAQSITEQLKQKGIPHFGIGYEYINKYFKLFPGEKAQELPVTKLIRIELYELLTDQNILPVENTLEKEVLTWATPMDAYFQAKLSEDVSAAMNDARQRSQKTEIEIDENPLFDKDVVDGAKLCGLKIVNCPNRVHKMIRQHSQCELMYLSPDVLVDVLRENPKRAIGKLSNFLHSTFTIGRCALPARYGDYQRVHDISANASHYRDAAPRGLVMIKKMVEYCMTIDSFTDKLPGLPLLVTADGELRRFSERKPVYKSPLMNVVKASSGKFLHPHLIDTFNRIQSPVFKELDVEGFCEELARNFPQLNTGSVIPVRDVDTQWIRTLWEVFDKIVGIGGEGELLHHIGNFSLCLTIDHRKQMLYPLKDMKKVFVKVVEGNLPTDKQSNMASLLKRIKLAEMPLSVYRSKIAERLMTTMYEPRDVVHNLHQYSLRDDKDIDFFKSPDLLRYLEFHHWSLHQHELEMIRELPIFCTLSGHYVAIAGGLAYAIPCVIPLIDMDAWKVTRGGIYFLEEKEEYKALYKAVGCIFWGVVDVYVKYIFEHFELLSENGKRQHIMFVLENLSDDVEITVAMSSLECVPNIGGRYCFPSDIFDPTVRIFQQLQRHDLPAIDLQTYKLLAGLRKLGMVSKANKEKLAEYAKLKRDAEVTAKLIYNYIRDKLSRAEQSTYLKYLASIPFIPRVQSGYAAICPDYTDNNYVTLRDSVLDRHGGLTWTVAPLISDLGFPDEVLASAGVITQPQPVLVVRNIIKICERGNTVGISATSRQEMSSLIDKCYAYLIKMPEEFEQAIGIIGKLMRDSCCIPVDQATRFIKPNQAVLEVGMDEEIKPYLYRLPDNLIFAKEILLTVAVNERVSLRTYQQVLHIIHEKYARERITNDEDIEAAWQATRQIFLRIQTDRSLDTRNQLWLLSSRNQLHRSQDIIYCNNVSIEQRLTKKLKLLADLKLRINVESLPEYFPATHRPRVLTAVVEEELDHSGYLDSEMAREMSTNLAADAFGEGLERLTYHIMINSDEHNETPVQEKLVAITMAVNKIDIKSAHNLRTRLKYGSEVLGEWGYVDACCDGSVFHIDSELELNGSTSVYLYKQLADLVNRQCKGFFHDHLALLMVLLSTEPAKLENRLDSSGIMRHKSITD